jgi:hypothetical protein
MVLVFGWKNVQSWSAIEVYGVGGVEARPYM